MISDGTELQRLCEHVLGSAELADTWLDTPSPVLEGRSPRASLRIAGGHERVRPLRLRIEHGLLA